MKKLALIFLLSTVIGHLSSSAQSTYPIYGDSVKFTTRLGTGATLVIENATKDTIGFLYNTGAGITLFKRAAVKKDDSTWIVGGDTMSIKTPQALLDAINGRLKSADSLSKYLTPTQLNAFGIDNAIANNNATTADRLINAIGHVFGITAYDLNITAANAINLNGLVYTQNINVTGAGGLALQNSTVSSSERATIIIADGSGINRMVHVPDKSGTVAFTNDISTDTATVYGYIVIGQSNATHMGDSSLSTKVDSTWATQWTNDSLKSGNDPVGNDGTGTGSMWPAFSSSNHAKTGHKINVIDNAIGGTCLVCSSLNGSWGSNDTLLSHAVTQAKHAQAYFESIRIHFICMGYIFLQGEADAVAVNNGTMTAHQYRDSLIGLHHRANAMWGDTTLPFFVIRIGERGPGVPLSNQYYGPIRLAQDSAELLDSGIYIASRTAVEFAKNGMMQAVGNHQHYTQNGYNWIGKEVGEYVASYKHERSNYSQLDKTGFGVGMFEPPANVSVSPNHDSTGQFYLKPGTGATINPLPGFIENYSDYLHYYNSSLVAEKFASDINTLTLTHKTIDISSSTGNKIQGFLVGQLPYYDTTLKNLVGTLNLYYDPINQQLIIKGSSASNTSMLSIMDSTASNNTSLNGINIEAITSAAMATGFGAGIGFQLMGSNRTLRQAGGVYPTRTKNDSSTALNHKVCLNGSCNVKVIDAATGGIIYVPVSQTNINTGAENTEGHVIENNTTKRLQRWQTSKYLNFVNVFQKTETNGMIPVFSQSDSAYHPVFLTGANGITSTQGDSAAILGLGAITPTSISTTGNTKTASFTTAYTAQTGTYAILATDHTIRCDATSAAFTATLPTAVGIAGQMYIVKRINSGANAVTVGTTSSQTIDGVTTYSLSAQYKFVRVQSDGANWMIIGSN